MESSGLPSPSRTRPRSDSLIPMDAVRPETRSRSPCRTPSTLPSGMVMTLPSLNPTTSTGNWRSPLLNQQTEPTVALGPCNSMELPTIFSTIPNSVRGSAEFNFSKCRDRSNARALLIEQSPANRIDLAGYPTVEMCLNGVDDEISALESGVFLHGNGCIRAADGLTDSLEILAADADFNALVTVDAFQCDGNHHCNQLRVDGRFALDDFLCDLQ